MDFNLKSPFEPKGSQPEAIKKLLSNFSNKKNSQTLLGVTGSGKSLDFNETVFIKDKEGRIKKIKIGEFVENNLLTPKRINDTDYQKVSSTFRIMSFNPNTFAVEECEIEEISKHKEDELYEIILDDYSKIKVTKDHNCFKFEDCKFVLSKTEDLKEGDYLPTSMVFPIGKGVKNINMMDYNPKSKIDIFGLIDAGLIKEKQLKEFFKGRERAYNWKVIQILNHGKMKGIWSEQYYELCEELGIDITKVGKYAKIISKKKQTSIKITVPIGENFLTFMGLYVSEGHNAKKYILISNSNKALQQKCIAFWDSLGLRHHIRNKNDVQYTSTKMANFFQIFGSIAQNKQMPSLIYTLSNKQLSIFLRAVFDGDGWVEKNAVLIVSASEQLVYDIKNVLLRFGITSRITHKRLKNKYSKNTYYYLSISGKANIVLFSKHISFSIDYKKTKLKKAIRENENTNVDFIPNCGKFISKIRIRYDLYQKDLAKIMKCERSYISMIESEKRSPSKKIFRKLVTWLTKKDKKFSYLKNITNYNFRKIISINKVKSSNGYVYDFSVKNNETFMAGSGNIFVHNTFTMANIIQSLKLPTLVLAHNKTLAAQLYNEFKEFFPENRVEYFVSYYDYYQPESYLPQKDQYIEKDAAINPKLELLRMSSTASLMSRKDVIVVASVSCIYGLGDPKNYKNLGIAIEKGMKMTRNELLGKLIAMQYERNDTELMPGRFRVRGDVIDIIPGYYEEIIRVEMFGNEVENITEIKKTENIQVDTFNYFYLYPARHFVVPESAKAHAIDSIKEELKDALPKLGDLEAHRLKKRTMYDIEMIQETGYCKGIENYSRHFDKRHEGEKPYVLLDYFPDDFLMIIDESHQTIPQLHAMYKGDRSRKQSLVDYGFRLPSAFDNRPLKFNEFEKYMKRVMFVSATPSHYEFDNSSDVVEQIIRPTGLVDPEIELRKTENQVSDIVEEIRKTNAMGNRTLITTLTKKLAEELSEYLAAKKIKTRYLHSEVYTLERTEIIRELRLGIFDVLVGINLLREGLDIPEIGLIGILDADKEGFLRDERSLIQTIGRAARNPESKVILYADKITYSIRKAVEETTRRRDIQNAYNKDHGITPQKMIKPIKEKVVDIKDTKSIPKKDIPNMIIELDARMKDAAERLNFEEAIAIRDRIRELEKRASEK